MGFEVIPEEDYAEELYKVGVKRYNIDYTFKGLKDFLSLMIGESLKGFYLRISDKDLVISDVYIKIYDSNHGKIQIVSDYLKSPKMCKDLLLALDNEIPTPENVNYYKKSYEYCKKSYNGITDLYSENDIIVHVDLNYELTLSNKSTNTSIISKYFNKEICVVSNESSIKSIKHKGLSIYDKSSIPNLYYIAWYGDNIMKF